MTTNNSFRKTVKFHIISFSAEKKICWLFKEESHKQLVFHANNAIWQMESVYLN